jgi:hypothetical protein
VPQGNSIKRQTFIEQKKITSPCMNAQSGGYPERRSASLVLGSDRESEDLPPCEKLGCDVDAKRPAPQ